MKRALYWCLPMFWMAACATSASQSKLEKKCLERIEFIKDNIFLQDTVYSIYAFKDKSELTAITEGFFLDGRCFEGWKKEEVRVLIGSPSVDFETLKEENKWWYYIVTPGCKSPGEECMVWEFVYNMQDKVVHFEERLQNAKPSYRH